MANLTFSQDWLTQKLKIGIDFGTTYSSVAFACTQKSHEIIPKVIPVGGFRLSQLNKVKFRLEYQVKTEIAWNPTLAKYVWGPEVEDSIRRKEILERDRITLLKLGLDDRKETGAIRARLVRQRAALPRIWDDNEAEFVMPSIEFLIAEYLKGLFVDARKYIKAKYRHLRQEDVFEASEVETVICVPAVWKAEMVDSMIRAALTAGIPNPYPVSEPDAAAAFMVVKKYENHEAEGENDETQEPFLVLDAGGGTTDGITYIVRSRSPLEMDEGAEGDGEICGSATLNERFRTEFASYIQNDLTRILEDMGRPNTKASEIELVNAAVVSFEMEGKRSFDGFSTPSLATVIFIPGLKRIEGSQIFNGCLKLSSELVKRVFRPVIDTILLLIQRQCDEFEAVHRYDVSNQIKSVIFVGGLSGNPHVVSEFNNALNGDEPLMGYPVNLTTPEDSALLIAKGGILRAINKDSIQKRFLRRSFGCCWSEQYDDKVHKPNSWEIGEFDGEPRVPDVVRWLYKKGDHIRQTCTRSERGYRCVYVAGTDTLDEYIFVSDVTRQNSLSVHDPANGIRHYGTLCLDLADIDTSRFPRQRSRKTKRSFFELEYEVRMTIRHLVLTFEMIVPEKGKFPVNQPALGSNPTDEQVRASWGPNPTRKALELNCGAAFRAGYA